MNNEKATFLQAYQRLRRAVQPFAKKEENGKNLRTKNVPVVVINNEEVVVGLN